MFDSPGVAVTNAVVPVGATGGGTGGPAADPGSATPLLSSSYSERSENTRCRVCWFNL